jgi:hypothetical protein
VRGPLVLFGLFFPVFHSVAATEHLLSSKLWLDRPTERGLNFVAEDMVREVVPHPGYASIYLQGTHKPPLRQRWVSLQWPWSQYHSRLCLTRVSGLASLVNELKTRRRNESWTVALY